MSRLTLMCFAWTLTISTAFADNPPPISTVRTLGDLRQITPIRLVDGQSVRIAITEPFPADAGTPWRLVYCMPVDAAAAPANRDGDPEGCLGPVTIRIIDGPRSVEVSGSNQNPVSKPITDGIYCAAVPTSVKGTFAVEILDPTGAVKDQPAMLLRSTIEVKDEPVCYWHRFATGLSKDTRVAPRPTAARPRYSGMIELAPPTDDAAALDGIGAGHPLSLALDQSIVEPALTIRSDANMINSPGEHLLARWWVNGKPIPAAAPESVDAKELQNGGWQISYSREMVLPVVLPQTLGKLKPGDHVTLQLMYCPAGIKPCYTRLRESQQQKLFVPRIIAHPDALPRVSEKLEIEVTEKILRP